MSSDSPIPKPTPLDKIRVIGHQGAGSVAEKLYAFRPNSMEALLFSAGLGIDIEVDASLSADGEVMLYHPEFRNDKGNKLVKLDLTNYTWLSIQKRRQHILHLADLINFLLSYPNMQCFLDIKQNSLELVEKIVKWLREAGMLERVYLTAPKVKLEFAGLYSDVSVLAYARNIEPRIRIHVIDEFPFNIEETSRIADGTNVISFGWLNSSWPSKILFHGLFYKKMFRQCIRLRENTSSQIMMGITETEKQVDRIITCTQGIIDMIQTDDPEMTLNFLRK